MSEMRLYDVKSVGAVIVSHLNASVSESQCRRLGAAAYTRAIYHSRCELNIRFKLNCTKYKPSIIRRRQVGRCSVVPQKGDMEPSRSRSSLSGYTHLDRPLVASVPARSGGMTVLGLGSLHDVWLPIFLCLRSQEAVLSVVWFED